MKHLSPEEQRDYIARQERVWATLAHNEGRYNLAQAKKHLKYGNRIIAAQLFQEANWDEWWAHRRQRIANGLRKK